MGFNVCHLLCYCWWSRILFLLIWIWKIGYHQKYNFLLFHSTLLFHSNFWFVSLQGIEGIGWMICLKYVLFESKCDVLEFFCFQSEMKETSLVDIFRWTTLYYVLCNKCFTRTFWKLNHITNDSFQFLSHNFESVFFWSQNSVNAIGAINHHHPISFPTHHTLSYGHSLTSSSVWPSSDSSARLSDGNNERY